MVSFWVGGEVDSEVVETNGFICTRDGDFGGGEGGEVMIGGGDFVGICWGGRAGEGLVTIASAEDSVELGAGDFDARGLCCSTIGVPVIKANISGDTSDLRDESFLGGGTNVAGEGTFVLELGESPMTAWSVAEAVVVESGKEFRGML